MSRILRITVPGVPAPQGSKRHVGNGRMIESSRHVKPWRESIRSAALDAMGDNWTPHTDAVSLMATFRMPRPKGHYGTGRNELLLRPSAPRQHIVKPDLDKLLRAVLDALTSAGVWRDDSQVTTIDAAKVYANDGRPGLHLIVMKAAPR